MLAGIIKEKNSEYYIYTDLTNNNFSWYIVRNYNGVVDYLDCNSANDFINNLFSYNLKFLEKKNDYYIFLDDCNNKRFFKDNIEDYDMFFTYNGVDAIQYNDSNKHNKRVVKKFTLNKNAVLVCGSLFILILGPKIGVDLYYIGEKVFSRYNVQIDYDKVNNMICNSNYLSSEDKSFLCNEDYLYDVLEYSPSERNYCLKEKFNDIGIDIFTKEERDTCMGYYSTLDLNTIHVRDDCLDEVNYNDVISHEFVHLTQSDFTKYNYIHEACAELFSYEYYDAEIRSYKDWVTRVKVLLEIIGPKPILECNFNSDSLLEESINKYLEKDDAIELLDAFTTTSTELGTMNKTEIKELNDKVDRLLAKMYHNKNLKNIEDDYLINLIYMDNNFENSDLKNRYYFNSHKEEFYNKTLLHESLYIADYNDAYDMILSDRVDKYVWESNKIYNEDEYNYLIDNCGKEFKNAIFGFEMVDGVAYDFSACDDRIYSYNGEHYTEDEIYDKGLIYKVFYVVDSVEVDDVSTINPQLNDKLCCYCNNGTRMEFNYDNKFKCWSNKDVKIYSPIYEESIYDKFSEQFDNKKVENIGNHISK